MCYVHLVLIASETCISDRIHMHLKAEWENENSLFASCLGFLKRINNVINNNNNKVDEDERKST